MDLATRPATFLWLIAATGTLLVATHRMDPVNLLPFMFLGTTFGARLLGIAYGLGGLRTDFWRPGTCKSHSTKPNSPCGNIRANRSTARRQQLWCSTTSPSGTALECR